MGGPSPRFDGPRGGVFVLVGGTEGDPVALFEQPCVQVLDGLQAVAQGGGADLADQRWWVGRFVTIHGVSRGAWWRGQRPRIVLGAGIFAHVAMPLSFFGRRSSADDAASARYGSSDSQPARLRSFHDSARSPSRSQPLCSILTTVVSSSPATNPTSTSVASSGSLPRCQV